MSHSDRRSPIGLVLLLAVLAAFAVAVARKVYLFKAKVAEYDRAGILDADR